MQQKFWYILGSITRKNRIFEHKNVISMFVGMILMLRISIRLFERRLLSQECMKFTLRFRRIHVEKISEN